MNDIPRLKLIEIIAQYGDSVIEYPRRMEGLLKDFCGEYKREIHSLMDAYYERVPFDLRMESGGTAHAALITDLTRRLLDTLPMSEDMARWTVETWAIGLGLLALPSVPEPANARLAQTACPVATPSGTVQPVQPQVLSLSRWEPQMMIIPAGEFLMGSTARQAAQAVKEGAEVTWVNREQPQRKLMLQKYAIGKYPVTCREYQIFIQSTGHNSPPGWDNNQYLFSNSNYPVTQVSWNDAQAYCAWLSAKTGKLYRLPNEAEWEKAARGPDGRIYPWGEQFEAGRANTWAARYNGPTIVGRFSPQGDSPYGCVDMVGNVWEWCADWYDGSGYAPQPVPGRINSNVLRSCRGGSWANPSQFARCAVRAGLAPDRRDDCLGFRVVLALPDSPKNVP
jgi:formylglycine-generating enzyme required for sulfatase activity